MILPLSRCLLAIICAVCMLWDILVSVGFLKKAIDDLCVYGVPNPNEWIKLIPPKFTFHKSEIHPLISLWLFNMLQGYYCILQQKKKYIRITLLIKSAAHMVIVTVACMLVKSIFCYIVIIYIEPQNKQFVIRSTPIAVYTLVHNLVIFQGCHSLWDARQVSYDPSVNVICPVDNSTQIIVFQKNTNSEHQMSLNILAWWSHTHLDVMRDKPYVFKS